ncbi:MULTISPECIES: YbjN domain-containing protein [Acidithrix]|uniref:YbjN domain-containing protein n=1 Tax=Acidithrix ferrooxidans TaxID=1280514 RepID=A0A0D8HIN0_9ACTN|nr:MULTISPECIES: YbjN domain-containing protein [Acidithrix]KJF17714.1 hypothetical protein AXFE_14220 [Acidithrix ferrooxidans]CAG4924261.1 unnamed protein product [Acidithrix sp. C25]
MTEPEISLSPLAQSIATFLAESGWGIESQDGLLTCLGGITTDTLELGYIATLAPDSDQILVSVVFELEVDETFKMELLLLLNEINKGVIPGSASYHFDDSMVELCSSLIVGGIDNLDDAQIEEIAIESFAQVHEILIGVALAAHMSIGELVSGVGVESAFSTFTNAIDTFIAALDLELDEEE